MAAEATPTRAVLLDALGTLVTFADPAPALRTELRERAGLEVAPDLARAAIRAEIAFYRANLGRARDAASLAALRADCADVVRREVGAPDAPLGAITDALVAAIAFAPYPEVPAALAALRDRGVAVAVVSNWDVSLHDVLADCGLTGFAFVLTSAEEGTAKPAPGLFDRALARLGLAPHEVLHVGDSVAEDVAGARAAGVPVVLVDRGERPAGPVPAGVPVVASLAEAAALAA